MERISNRWSWGQAAETSRVGRSCRGSQLPSALFVAVSEEHAGRGSGADAGA